MRALVSGAGEFLGAHLDLALQEAGHVRVAPAAVPRTVDAVIHLSPDRVRATLDRAFALGARVFVFLSAVGADSASPRRQLAARGRAEELVRAAGLPWVILRPEILWGPGDVFTSELAHLLRHLPFVPVPRGGPTLSPVYAGDVARALAELLERPELWRDAWSLTGPEPLRYAEVVERVAAALRLGRRRRPLPVPAWAVRIGASLEERLARRPRHTRALLDRLVAGARPHRPDEAGPRLSIPMRLMTVDALSGYL